MARNVEIKARAQDFEAQRELATSLSDTPLQILHQRDTFFQVPQGRLKLREFPDAPAQLIYYTRPDHHGPKLSDYHIAPVDCADSLTSVLEKAYGIQAIVVKERHLFMHGRTRLHFDQVQNLGAFIELEVVLQEHERTDQGELEAQQLMQALNVREQDLITVAYLDLLMEGPCQS